MRHHDDHDPNWTNHMIPIWKFPSFDRITISFVLSFGFLFSLSPLSSRLAIPAGGRYAPHPST